MNPQEEALFWDKCIRLKYRFRPVRPDLTLQELAEVVLILSQEVTDLQKKIRELEARQQRKVVHNN